MTDEPKNLTAEAECVAQRIRARGGWVSDDLKIKPEDAALMLDTTVENLRNWRYLDKGPKPIYRGRNVYYFIVDVLAEFKTDRAA